MSSAAKKAKSKNSSIESTMKSLESQLEKLEKEETPLEEAMESFEAGVILVREAQQILNTAEQRISLLTEDDGEPKEVSFDLGESRE